MVYLQQWQEDLPNEFTTAKHKEIPEAWNRDSTAGEGWLLGFLNRHDHSHT
jgi:hypothetical protein